VILSPLALEMEDLQPSHVGVPLVLLGERLLGSPWDHVMPDNVAAAQLATTHLIGLGRYRIAAIGAQDTAAGETARMRLRGYTYALEEAGQAVDPRLIEPAAAFHRANGAAAMRRLLALPRPPDAVFCFNDLLALGAMHAIQQAGRRIPDDVAVVGFDDVEEGRYARPSLTTIAPDKEEIGRRAVSLLLERINGTRTGPPERVEPPFKLVARESTVGRC
jgi:DNA-binding LacI/PurR family transcriptional regulator